MNNDLVADAAKLLESLARTMATQRGQLLKDAARDATKMASNLRHMVSQPPSVDVELLAWHAARVAELREMNPNADDSEVLGTALRETIAQHERLAAGRGK